MKYKKFNEEAVAICSVSSSSSLLLRKRLMDVLKRLKGSTLYVISVFALLFLYCLIFYISTNPVLSMGTPASWPRKSQHKLEPEDPLEEVLRNASMPNKTVILTTVNEAWAVPGSIMDLFLESFRIGESTSSLLNHLLIIAVDEKAYSRCKSIHPHCFSLITPGVNFTSEKRYMTPDYLKLVWRKIDLLRTVLEYGYNFVFTDADIMWLRDPFPYLDNRNELQITCDTYGGNPYNKWNRVNTGFSYVESSKDTINFYKHWYSARITYPNLHDQDVFKIIAKGTIVNATGLTIKYLDTMYFGGFCQPSKDMNKVCTMHANCCVGIKNKVYDLKLVLDDWRNFTTLSPEQRILQRIPTARHSPWSAPSKCNT